MSPIDAFTKPLPSDRVHEHVNVFLKTPSSIYLGHIASAAVLLYIARTTSAVPTWFLFVWGATELFGYPALMELWRRAYFWKTAKDRDPYLWIRLMDLLSFAVGISWGTMVFLSLNPDNAAHFAIQMSITAGAVAAAVRSLATFPRSFLLYALPFLGLVSIRLMWLGGDFILLGLLVLVFLAMMLRFGADVLDSVSQYIDISNENLQLAQSFREAADEAEHANREKTRLLAAASHDLRQPIHAIGLYMESLPIDRMEKRSKETLLRIRSSLQALSKLFNSLLDVSLLDSGKIQLRPSVFDLEDMLNLILDDYEPLAEIAHVTLLLECPKVGVIGDPILIRRMVQNLLSNAIRHSDGGLVRIEVDEDGQTLNITVSDDGPGIAKEHQAVIFEEFTQVAERSKRLASAKNLGTGQERGLGLGLAIVRRLADLQHLKLDLETGSGGTSLRIIGLKSAPLSDEINVPPHLSERAGARFKQKRVLVVDDDNETLQATVALLKKWGCQVAAARNMQEMQQIDGDIDLVISDYSFGTDYTGIDIISSAHQKFGASVKTLIVSGDSSELVQRRIEEAGLLLIYKPVQPVQLRSAMLEMFLSSSSGDQVIS